MRERTVRQKDRRRGRPTGVVAGTVGRLPAIAAPGPATVVRVPS